MEQRTLGEGLQVPAIGLGCYGMSSSYGPGDREESIATIRRALDLEVTFLDTSDVYGLGHNERLVGEALAGRRSEAILATKFGAVRSEAGADYETNGRPEYVASACEASLDRLGVEVIDLYYQHRMDPETPIEETVGAMARLVEAGKVRFLGLSECSAETLRRAHSVHPIAAVQVEYSLFTREPAEALLPTCRELGVGLVAYSPLGRGMLTGAIASRDDLSAEDVRRRHPRFESENLDRNGALVAALREMAAARGCTAGQLALAWLLSRGDDVVAIPGTKRRSYLEENAGAAEVGLSAEELASLDEVFAVGRVAGARYGVEELRRVGL